MPNTRLKPDVLALFYLNGLKCFHQGPMSRRIPYIGKQLEESKYVLWSCFSKQWKLFILRLQEVPPSSEHEPDIQEWFDHGAPFI